MHTGILLLLFFVGGAGGCLSGALGICSMLLMVSGIFLFAPIIGADNDVLSLIATGIASCLPILLYEWLSYLKKQNVNVDSIVYWAPGMVLGGVIGAQLFAFIPLLFLKAMFSLLIVLTIVNIVLFYRPFALPVSGSFRYFRILLGAAIGTLSIVSGHTGKVPAESILRFKGGSPDQLNGTVSGLALFTTIAAVVSLLFPAQVKAFSFANEMMVGMIYLPALGVFITGQLLGFWLGKQGGSQLDKMIMHVFLTAFFLLTLIRIWLGK